jgi:hypothetical protein
VVIYSCAFHFAHEAAAHGPPKCERFGDKAMRNLKLTRGRTQNRCPLLLAARGAHPAFRAPSSSEGGNAHRTPQAHSRRGIAKLCLLSRWIAGIISQVMTKVLFGKCHHRAK